MDLSVFSLPVRKRKPKVLFPEGFPACEKGRFALYTGGRFIMQSHDLAKVERRAKRCAAERHAIIDLAVDFSHHCF